MKFVTKLTNVSMKYYATMPQFEYRKTKIKISKRKKKFSTKSITLKSINFTNKRKRKSSLRFKTLKN